MQDEQIRQLYERVATLQAQNEALFKEFQERRDQSSYKPAIHSIQGPRIKDTLPPVYTGRSDRRHSVAGWLFKARNFLDLHQLGQTKEGIHYIVGQLEGQILSWYIARVNHVVHQDARELLEDLAAFLNPQEEHFVAREKLRYLKQTSSVSQYLEKCLELTMKISDIGEAEKLDRFIAGLKQEVQLQVVLQQPKSFTVASNIAIAVDSVLYRNKASHTYLIPSERSQTMDLDAVQTRGYVKLTDKERSRLKENQGCFFCRKTHAGHIARNCPDKINRIKAIETYDGEGYTGINTVTLPTIAGSKTLSLSSNKPFSRNKFPFQKLIPLAVKDKFEFTAQLQSEGKEICTSFLLDSGCNAMVISKAFVKRHALPTQPCRQQNFKFANGSNGATTRKCIFRLLCKGYSKLIQCYVTDIKQDLIIGLPFIESILVTRVNWIAGEFHFKDLRTGKSFQWMGKGKSQENADMQEETEKVADEGAAIRAMNSEEAEIKGRNQQEAAEKIAEEETAIRIMSPEEAEIKGMNQQETAEKIAEEEKAIRVMSSEEAAIKGMNQQEIAIECTDTYCKDEVARIKVEFNEVFEKPNSLPPQRPEDHRIELTKDAKLPPWRPLGRLNMLELKALKERSRSSQKKDSFHQVSHNLGQRSCSQKRKMESYDYVSIIEG